VRPYAGTGDGTLRVAYDVLGAETEGVFDFDYRTAFPNDPSGIYRGRIQPIDAAGNPIAGSECCPPFLFWLDPDHTAKNILLEIAQNGPWEWIKETDPYNCGASATYPQGLTPTYRGTVRPRLPVLARPRPENLTPYVDFVFDPAKPVSTERLRLSRHNIGGAAEEGNRWYSQMTDRGIWVTDNAQLYYFSQGPVSFVNGKLPIYPLMDGPNGVATVGFTTWNWVGRARKLYFGSPWSARVADSTLAVRTFIGIYSVYPAHYDDLVAAMQKGVLHPSLRMRGVYPPGTPPLECFPLHMWFLVFLPPTVVQGTGPVRQDSTMLVAESPHPQNPVSVHGDYGHGFVDWFEHDKDDHTVEPRCIYRLPVPGAFGGAYSALTEKVYVASRFKHQILEIDPYLKKDANGNYLPPAVRVVLDGGAAAAALGAITPADDTFRLVAGKTPADARAAKCVDPTGLDLDLRGEWCYVGSMPMGGVFRVNVVDGRWEWARDVVTTDIQSHFVNVALSDGTAGFALDTLLTCTFDNQYFGRFKAWAPVPSATQTHSVAVDWQYFSYHQSAGVTATGGSMVSVYPMAPYARKGAIVCGGSQEWIEIYTLRDAAEVAPSAAALKEGHREFAQIGGYLQYGRLGSGPSIPPKGLTLNSDAWLTANGVVPGAQPAPPVAEPPPVTPPPITGISMFKSITKVQTGTYPPLPTQGQRAVWRMHGSGGGWDTTRTDPTLPQQDYYNGDQWDGVADTFAPDQHYDLHAYSGGAYGSTLTPPNPVPYTVFAPVDRSALGQGRNSETLHLGYTRGTAKVFSDYTMRAYTAWRAWAPTQYPQVDFSRGVVIHDTNSMGAWASLIAMRQPDVAAVYATQPRWKATSVADWEANVASGAVPAGLLCDDGVAFAARYDSIAYVSDRNNRLPPLFWTVATSDNFTPIADHKAAVAAIQARNRDPQTTNAQRVLFSFKWVPGAHGASGTAIPASSTAPGLDYPDWRLFELDKGYPVFDRCSLDDDINAASGWINRGLLFGNVVESASGFSCDVWCTRGACDTDVSVHSDVFAAPVTAQRVSIPANQRVTVAFSAQNLPPPDPLISGVTVTPSAEALGGPVQINANVTNAASVTLNGQPVTLPVTVTPTSATDTFTLVATGAPGTASAQIVIGRPGWSA
jgi:hypothetical protein